MRWGEESPSHGFAVTAPFRQGGRGDGGADCHSQCAHWLRNDMVFIGGAVRWDDVGIVPYGSVIDGAVGRGDVGIAPYGGATRGAVRCRRADRGVRPYGGLQEVR